MNNDAVKLLEAKQECQRWFDYLQRQVDKSKAIQELASERRKGTIDEHEARRRLQQIDLGVTVYDGANLEKAVRVLIAAMNAPTPREQELETRVGNIIEANDARLAYGDEALFRESILKAAAAIQKAKGM